MANISSHQELNARVKILIDFAGALQDVEGNLHKTIENLQTLEQEISQEDTNLGPFIQNEVLPEIGKMEDGQTTKEEVAQLIKDEEKARSSIVKIASDLDTEVKELSNFFQMLERLEEKAKQAEEAMEELESLEKNMT